MSIPIVDDTEVEQVEVFLVSIHVPVNEERVDIPSSTASVYITNNDGKKLTCTCCLVSKYNNYGLYIFRYIYDWLGCDILI